MERGDRQTAGPGDDALPDWLTPSRSARTVRKSPPPAQDQDGAAMGRGDGQTAGHADGAWRRGLGRGIQPGRNENRHGQPGQDRAAVGCGDTQNDRFAHETRQRGLRRGVQPGRNEARHRQQRQDRRGCGTRRRASRGAGQCSMARESSPWRSAQTGRKSPPQATTRRRGCGT